jgi:cysteine desulfurase / selenocysteine lyase
VINHASNVTGVIQDVSSIAQIAKDHHAIFMVDAAQTLGYIPINVQSMGISILAAPGHKGAGGVLGTGILVVDDSIADQLVPAWVGGSGLNSDSIEGPFSWQEGLESGNANVGAIASLRAGIEWVLSSKQSALQDSASTHGQLNQWIDEIIECVRPCSSLNVVGPQDSSRCKMPIASIVHNAVSCHELALFLDSACHVEARSGFHCASKIHHALGTHTSGGTLRLSLGHTSTEADFLAGMEAIKLLAQTFGS